MRKVRRFFAQITNLFRREHAEREFGAELEAHLALMQEEFESRGMAPHEARREARVRLGGVEQVKELQREARTLGWLETVWQDVRFATRMLRKSPGFTAVVVLTLALGIGATTAIFSLVDVVLFRPLPIAHPNEVFRITSGTTKDISRYGTMSFPSFVALRDGSSVFTDMAACIGLPADFSAPGAGSGRDVLAIATGDYFATLGVKAELGRMITADDDREGAAPVAVISDSFWRSQFSASRSVLGTTAIIDGQSFTIVGVTPAGFGGVVFGNLPQIWVPASIGFKTDPVLKYQMPLNHESFEPFTVVARLKTGVPVSAAQEQIDAIAKGLGAGQLLPGEEGKAGFVRLWPVLVPAEKEARLGFTRYALLILGTVSLVLLIACANASGLLLARSELRRKEIAVRSALGATRGRIVRLQMIEVLLIGVLGVIIGCVIAYASEKTLIAGAPETLLMLADRTASILDGRVLGFAILAALVSAVISGLGPALRSSRTDLVSAMKSERPALSAGARRISLHDLFVVVQVSASVILLIGAALLARTLWRVTHMSLGFDPAHTITASVDPIRNGYDKTRAAAMLGPLADSLRAQPGVRFAALVGGMPFGNISFTTVTIEGHKADSPLGTKISMGIVEPGYFQTLGIPLLRGRDFTEGDTADGLKVAIASETAAREFWAGENPIGEIVERVGPRDETFEIIGVAADITTGFTDFIPEPTIYIPLAQGYTLFPFLPTITLIARGSGDPTALVPALREAVRRIDPALPLFQINTMEEQMEKADPERRFLERVLLIFAALATLLCAAGIYAQASYATAALTRDFGIRMALGAEPRDILRMVLGRGARLGAAGLVIGCAGALALTGLLKSLLFGVTPFDPVTFAAVAVVFTAVALAASCVPAWRAMRVDPMAVLRQE